MQARDITAGDVLTLKGNPWTVDAAEPTADGILLRVVSGGSSFAKVFPPDTDFEVARAGVVAAPSAEVPEALAAIGATFLYYLDDAGVYHLPPVTDITLAGHLLTYHGVTWEGISVRAARALVPNIERMHPNEGLAAADVVAMQRLHDTLHETPEAMPTRHLHDATEGA